MVERRNETRAERRAPKPLWRGPKLRDGDPARWLARRLGPGREWLARFWVGSGLLWLGGLLVLRHSAAPVWVVLNALYLWHVVVKIWMAIEATHRWCEDRRSGALEILLTTPLTPRRLFFGWLTGLFGLYLWPCVGLLAMDLHLWSQSGAGGELMALVFVISVFVSDAYALVWMGMWQGVRNESGSRAFLRTFILVLVVPWLISASLGFLIGILGGSIAGVGWALLLVVWWMVSIGVDLVCSVWAIYHLSETENRHALASGRALE